MFLFDHARHRRIDAGRLGESCWSISPSGTSRNSRWEFHEIGNLLVVFPDLVSPA